MNIIIIVAVILVVMIAAKLLYKILSHKSLFPLLPKEYNFKRRRNSFRLSLKLMEERNAKILVETGVARKGLRNTKYDGASTIVFGLWSKQNNAILHSIDIDPEAVEEARKEAENSNLLDFVKISSVIALDPDTAATLSPIASDFADTEKLTAHANASKIRMKSTE